LTIATVGCNDSASGPNSLTNTGRAGAGGPPGDEICLGPDGTPLPTAPASQRVDLAEPAFSNPTRVTNPLFPVARQFRVLQLGTVDGLPFRAEVTLLEDTKTIDVDVGGAPVENLVSQYAAFLDGEIHEVALDFYAQADDGAVWYFGEDVYNYEDGLIADTDGTWLAGRDGTAAMIMPGNPQLGDVYRPENICGLVFEEVVVKSIGVTVDGPRGPVAGAIVAEELHMDATREDKTFAPGYGEFATGSGDDREVLAIAVPEDALPGLPPSELETAASAAGEIFEAASSADWEAAAGSLGEITAAWEAFRSGALPPILKAEFDSALTRLAGTVTARDPAEARRAALAVTLAGLDLQLSYRTAAETDLDLLDLWARRLIVEAEEGDRGRVLGAAATLGWIRDRIARDVSFEELQAIDARLNGLRAAVRVGDLTAAGRAATSLRSTLTGTRVIVSER
ncbi:MAG: hypothetical protein M3Q93_15295, partial [Gemmatimonadota bacterium]|nr:hypothetical protein [Gemmatimonadota bacterium]